MTKRRLFDVIKCFNCGTGHLIVRTAFNELRRDYPNISEFPLQCCKDPSLGWPGINSMDTVLLEVD